MNLSLIQTAFSKYPGDVHSAAKELGITPTLLMQKMRHLEQRSENGVSYIIPMIQSPTEVGRESLRPFIISIRRVGEWGWPLQDREAIVQARKDHDAGLSDMFQAHENGLIIQYNKPRRRRDYARRPWFKAESI